MRKHTAAEMLTLLRNEGLVFRTFELTHEGDYTVDDADWNYKDVPHLKHIHQLVDAYPSWLGDSAVAAVIVQKALGLKIPLTLFNFENEPNRQTYHTSFLFFVLVIQTSFEALGPLRTRVTTQYNLGGPRWILPLVFPIARWLLKRNYADLMSGDIPMRERRGLIQKWGYRIIKRKPTYSFIDTTKIFEENIVPPLSGREWGTREIPLADIQEGNCLMVGEADHYGLQLVKKGGVVNAFPRMCPHEGASLDCAHAGDEVRCPWHARKFAPLLSIPLHAGQPLETMFHVFTVRGDRLVIACKATPARALPVEAPPPAAAAGKKASRG